ncbi:MAG: hypothetical protein Q9160_000399 [Pyrenula sp. 1 TL-2023]
MQVTSLSSSITAGKGGHHEICESEGNKHQEKRLEVDGGMYDAGTNDAGMNDAVVDDTMTVNAVPTWQDPEDMSHLDIDRNLSGQPRSNNPQLYLQEARRQLQDALAEKNVFRDLDIHYHTGWYYEEENPPCWTAAELRTHRPDEHDEFLEWARSQLYGRWRSEDYMWPRWRWSVQRSLVKRRVSVSLEASKLRENLWRNILEECKKEKETRAAAAARQERAWEFFIRREVGIMMRTARKLNIRALAERMRSLGFPRRPPPQLLAELQGSQSTS